MPMPAIRLSRRDIAALFIGLAVAPGAARATTRRLHAPQGLALDGHDPVAFFTEGRPMPGQAAFVGRWCAAEWRFASAANRDRFLAAPESFAPQYGGHCAWAAAQGYVAPGDPRHWAIRDGRLFVNFDAGVHRRWLRDVRGFIAAADRNWPRLEAG